MQDEDLFDIDELKSLPKKSIKPMAWVVGVLAVSLAVWGIFSRDRDARELHVWTEAQAIPSVKVLHPYRSDKTASLILPGNIQAYYQAPIFARVNGYLKFWYHDIGDRVKAGDVLAEIDTPDLDQEYERAKSKVLKAKADQALAQITADRWQKLVVTDAVSKQERDQKVAGLEVQTAEVKGAEADLGNVQAFENFKKLRAPFDGVVTARKTDIGALIDAGKGEELFTVSQINPLRLYVPVPQFYAPMVKLGIEATLVVPEYPNSIFSGTVIQISKNISQKTGTMLAELILDNSEQRLSPGDYAKVKFSLSGKEGNSLRVPSSALILRTDGIRVAVVSKDSQIQLKKINLGRDFGRDVEVLAGVTPLDNVVDSPPDFIFEGEKVNVMPTKAPAPGK
ncbi:efflux RND transporter periplasmic adaptor subunit [Ferrovum myxofaciens]|uniref:Efflux RND transporter periplasmic adaptor subunit n=2 Tax=Ferrovum myxofaciens TaxID=416213 RepID=A0A9E6SWY6_9PROT|nr:efflux RND transporter periplasmic adaptor subunit [Ferrovum myxofaciens]QKE38892.1 MAG: efflux RND transporter periplasmic adaptor subunit [Ferrovum myxofaciens]QWY74100.1 MAG: efflux RND transporter periplasmic adaptor subunit [Ferrovum myxofaciens]QWY76852.1 MAG: efflux RND transporter periplasmic adaptor subunit [Ferrovum myxofaciens]